MNPKGMIANQDGFGQGRRAKMLKVLLIPFFFLQVEMNRIGK